jgi:hypothetical protein
MSSRESNEGLRLWTIAQKATPSCQLSVKSLTCTGVPCNVLRAQYNNRSFTLVPFTPACYENSLIIAFKRVPFISLWWSWYRWIRFQIIDIMIFSFPSTTSVLMRYERKNLNVTQERYLLLLCWTALPLDWQWTAVLSQHFECIARVILRLWVWVVLSLCMRCKHCIRECADKRKITPVTSPTKAASSMPSWKLVDKSAKE